MRLISKLTGNFLLAVMICVATHARAGNPLDWSPAFLELDESHADNALVVLVVTNDVDPLWLKASKVRQTDESSGFWCEAAFVEAASQIDPAYFHPSSPIYWQRISIGLPPILTGGIPHGDVPRALIVLTDGRYRFLEMMVGVPERTDLSKLIEDAEETRMWLNQHCQGPTEAFPARVVDEVVRRNRDRLGRLWKSELDRQQRALGEKPFQTNVDQKAVDPLNDLVGFSKLVMTRLRSIASQLQTVYLQDSQSRFGLTEESDIQRLAVLEQHTATRRSWVSCLSPFLAGADTREIYVPLAEIVWNRRVMPATSSVDDLITDSTLTAWIEGQGDRQPFALRLPSPFLAAGKSIRRVEVSKVAQRRGLGWGDLNTELQKLPNVETNPLQLAKWLHRTGGRPIDLNRPSPTQTLFFRSAADQPYPIRDGEPPGRSVTMIRKVQR